MSNELGQLNIMHSLYCSTKNLIHSYVTFNPFIVRNKCWQQGGSNSLLIIKIIEMNEDEAVNRTTKQNKNNEPVSE